MKAGYNIHPRLPSVIPITNWEFDTPQVFESKDSGQVLLKTSIDCMPIWTPARQVLIRHLLDLATFIGDGQLKHNRPFPATMHKIILK
jgi:hypothetical protein